MLQHKMIVTYRRFYMPDYYEVCKNQLEWMIKQLLSNRTQSVILEHYKSYPFDVVSGVPLGDCDGPIILFSLHQ